MWQYPILYSLPISVITDSVKLRQGKAHVAAQMPTARCHRREGGYLRLPNGQWKMFCSFDSDLKTGNGQ